ncbi:MAG: 3-hydroxyacyl-CoA dehydrogenase family protein [Deltaproteobacteria bacterium]|nr:3-hydroxyacyl-CoA dehydrogenase family protein [Deltaproteobacteria bacterium]MBW2301981.1 3-hydroxyacyl-CoA dehydrogenase family protein [Deltaproteobacteria bacterium]
MVTKADIKKVFVVGAGTMGHGIAQAFAQGGYQVTLYSRSQKTLDRASELIKSSLDTLAEGKLLAKTEIPAVISRITFTRSLEEGAHDADLALETVAEDADIKKEIFKKLDTYCPRRALLASNTTFLNIFDIVDTSRPDKILICHWYAPAQIIPLVDVVKGPGTEQANVQMLADILTDIGKEPVIFNRYVSGYVVSRLQIALQREVHFLLDNEYLSPQELDKAAKWGLALRMMVVGVVQRFDFGGLDLSARNLEKPAIECTPLDYKPKKLFELVRQGHLGVKSGKGFYDYKGMTEAEICKERDRKLIKMLKVLTESNH